MTSDARPRQLILLLAAIWPFLREDLAAHRLGTQACAAVLVALSFVAVLGWLRTLPLYQPAAVAAGAYATGRLLADDQTILIVLPVAAICGAAVGLLALAPVLRRARPLLPASSLLVAALVVLVGLPRLQPTAFARPTFLGFDLSVEKNLYLLALVLAGASWTAMANLHRGDLGRHASALGASPDLAARAGTRSAAVWVQCVALSGALAALGGGVGAMLQQGASAPAAFGLATVLMPLAAAVAGGLAWPSGAVLGAVLLVVGPRLLSVPDTVAAGVVLVASLLALPGGVIGAVRAQMVRTHAVRGSA